MHIGFRKSFTLVELLIVVSIIAILIAILLPVLGMAKKSAQKIKCIGNIRQFAMCGISYWDDNNGWMACVGNHPQDNLEYFISQMNSAIPTILLSGGGKQYPRVDKSRTKLHLGMMCPETKRYLADLKSNSYPFSYGYWQNYSRTFLNIRKSSQIFSPSGKVYMMDGPSSVLGGETGLCYANIWDITPACYFPGVFAYNRSINLNGIASAIYPADKIPVLEDIRNGRHTRTLNAAFLDGHVENRPISYYAKDYFNPIDKNGTVVTLDPAHPGNNIVHNMFSPFQK